jgi:hypothetical protein
MVRISHDDGFETIITPERWNHQSNESENSFLKLQKSVSLYVCADTPQKIDQFTKTELSNLIRPNEFLHFFARQISMCGHTIDDLKDSMLF